MALRHTLPVQTVKVQRPMVGNENLPDAYLVYAEGRKNPKLMSIPPAVKAALGNDIKGYFSATYHDRTWHITERVADQGW